MSRAMLAAALLLPLLPSASGASGDKTMAATPVVDEGLAAELRALAGKRVWFGHHSVGADILAGARALAREAGVQFVVDEAPIGENGKPLEKISDFERAAIASQADVVVMKLCYVDFTPSTNVEELIDAYAAAVQRVRAARPGVRVVHITPPLTVRPTDVKARVQRLIGRPVWEDEANLRRLEFAELMLARFANEPVLHLAQLESTTAQGARELHTVAVDDHARAVPMLWPGWSRDGGHLNDAGRRMAGRAFIRVLKEAL